MKKGSIMKANWTAHIKKTASSINKNNTIRSPI